MELSDIRKELNKYDYVIRNMIAIRMGLIPIVADIKREKNLEIVQNSREAEMYKKMEEFALNSGISAPLLKDIYKMIISDAIRIEEEYIDNDKKIQNYNYSEIMDEFKKLDNIIENEIPDILKNIEEKCQKNDTNLNECATLFYNKNDKRDCNN